MSTLIRHVPGACLVLAVLLAAPSPAAAQDVTQEQMRRMQQQMEHMRRMMDRMDRIRERMRTP
jgi:hypothetical protein